MKELMALFMAAAVTLAWAGNVTRASAAQSIHSLQNEPSITVRREHTNVIISFKGALQSAETVTGPWTDLPEVITPFQSVPAHLQRFYRARTPDSIFSSTSVVAFTVTGPLQKHFELAYAGLPDGIFPPVREKPYFDGELAIYGLNIPISLRVRGNSSLQECPFPKLKFKVAPEERTGTPFVDAREVKIGTHCAEGGRGTIGRLRDQIAAYREVQAYETMGLLGFVTPRVRRARVTYIDNSPTNTTPEGGWQVTREGLILDDVEVLAERMSGRALDDEEVAQLTDANFAPQLITDLRFLHALLGNWDYRLSTNGVGLWNTEVIEQSGGDLVPVAADFDLASWVTGQVRFMGPPSYEPGLPETDRQARYELEQIKQSVTAEQFMAARDRFAVKRTAIESQIGAALIDGLGRTNCWRHVTAFYEAIAAIDR